MRAHGHAPVLLTAWGLLATSSCMTMGGYAAAYERAKETGPGMESSAELKERIDGTEQSRTIVVGDADRARQLSHCEYYRNQLVVASEKARSQIWLAWALPCMWPVDIVTCGIYPIMQTMQALEVIEAAERLERSYQESEESFHAACLQERATDLGKKFQERNQLPY